MPTLLISCLVFLYSCSLFAGQDTALIIHFQDDIAITKNSLNSLKAAFAEGDLDLELRVVSINAGYLFYNRVKIRNELKMKLEQEVRSEDRISYLEAVSKTLDVNS